MNLSKLANISEIVSSFAIVITLIFLTLQMQQNTKAIEAASIQTANNSNITFILRSIDDPNLLLTMTKEQLSVEERIQLGSWLSVASQNHESIWSQHQLGVIDKETLKRFETSFRWMLSFQRARNWVQNVGPSIFTPSFMEHVNELLRSTPVTTEPPEVYFTKIFESTAAIQ